MTGDLLGAVLTSVLAGGRPRRSRRAQRFLGGGGFINANTVLTAAGLAWGAYESWRAQQEPAAGGPAGGVPPVPATPPPPVSEPSTSKTERLVRIAVAAAHADGTLTEQERTSLEAQAREAGASQELAEALREPVSLERIVAGVIDPAEKTTLYMVAFTVLRADEQLTGTERIFLAKLASLLGLSPGAAATIEQTVAERIDAQPEG